MNLNQRIIPLKFSTLISNQKKRLIKKIILSGSFVSEITLQKSQNIEYFISNKEGKVIYIKNIFMQSGNNKVPFDINLPSGLYFISMKLENGQVFSDKILFKN